MSILSDCMLSYCRRLGFFIFALVLCGVTLLSPGLSADPVTDFIVRCDSLAQAGADELLASCIMDRSVLVGAAVGQLLDIGFQVGETGDKAAEEENVLFARRLAEIYSGLTGSSPVLDLVITHQGWTASQRADRSRAKKLEEEAVIARNSGELEKAFDLFQKALGLYEEIGDSHSLAVTWGSLGVVCWYQGDMDLVRDCYEKALKARRAVEDHILEGRTLNGLGSTNLMTGKYREAIDFYEKAIVIRRKTGDIAGLGTSLTYLGNVYFRLGRLVDARDWFEQALPVLEQSGNTRQMVELLISIGGIHAEMGRYKASNESNRKAAELSIASEDISSEIICILNIADNLMMTSRYREALSKLEKARTLLGSHPDPVLLLAMHRIRGLVNMRIGELESSRDDLLLCLEISREMDDPHHRIEALLNLGYLYLDLGAYETSRTSALEAGKKAKESGNERMVCEAVLLEAEAEHRMLHYDRALDKYRQALEMNEAGGYQTKVTESKLSIANALAQSGKMIEARLVLRDLSDEIGETGSDTYKYSRHMAMAHTFETEDPDSAFIYYETAFRIMDDSREALGGTETKTGFLSGERRHLYEEVAIYYNAMSRSDNKRDWMANAFRTIERSKARGLLDMLESAVLSEDSQEEEAVLDSLYRLDPEFQGYMETERRLKLRYSELREQRFGNLFGSESMIVELKNVRKALPRKTALLEYALGDTVSLLFLLDRKGVEIFELPGRSELRVDVNRLRDALGAPGIADAALKKYARRLYRILVQPAEARISKVNNLIIIPDGVLFDIPFELLLTGDPVADAGWESQPFLTRSYSTVYAPSASVYMKMLESGRNRKYDKDLVAFGDPDFSGIGDDAGFAKGLLPRLPHTKAEVLDISSNLKDNRKSIFLGNEASEKTLKDNLRKGSPRILHLATHGVVDPVQPSASCIVLSSDLEAGEDGRFHTLEILSVPMEVGLVVLSACESGRGRINRGEGVVGLSRALIASGAGSVVVSLWAVSDESTAALMGNFYKIMLGKKRPAARALRASRLKMIENRDYAHPFYWAAFVMIGTKRSPW